MSQLPVTWPSHLRPVPGMDLLEPPSDYESLWRELFADFDCWMPTECAVNCANAVVREVREYWER